jgi:hypothetical protein
MLIDRSHTRDDRLAELHMGSGSSAIVKDERYQAFISLALLPALPALGREVRFAFGVDSFSRCHTLFSYPHHDTNHHHRPPPPFSACRYTSTA